MTAQQKTLSNLIQLSITRDRILCEQMRLEIPRKDFIRQDSQRTHIYMTRVKQFKKI